MKQHPIWNTLSHAIAIGSCMFIIFFFIDRVNPAMDFLGSSLSKWCLFFYCVASLLTALCSAVYLFKREKAAGKKQHATHHSPQDEPYARSELPVQRHALPETYSGRHRAVESDVRHAYLTHGRETIRDTRHESGNER